MIVASQYGWQAVTGPNAMAYSDLLLAAQLLSEERVGRQVRKNSGTSASQEADRIGRLRLHTPE